MRAIEEQFERLERAYPGSTIQKTDSGGYVVKIPKMPTRGRWDQKEVEARFYVPPGFPCVCPENFWVYPDVHVLESSGHKAWPARSFGGVGRWLYPDEHDEPFPNGESGRSNPMPGVPGFHGRWFAWHLQAWNPNHCELFTFAKVIEQRLQIDITDRALSGPMELSA